MKFIFPRVLPGHISLANINLLIKEVMLPLINLCYDFNLYIDRAYKTIHLVYLYTVKTAMITVANTMTMRR